MATSGLPKTRPVKDIKLNVRKDGEVFSKVITHEGGADNQDLYAAFLKFMQELGIETDYSILKFREVPNDGEQYLYGDDLEL